MEHDGEMLADVFSYDFMDADGCKRSSFSVIIKFKAVSSSSQEAAWPVVAISLINRS